MGRILGIDYGRKRVGIALTDTLQIIASPKETVPTHTIWDYLSKLFNDESIDEVVIGMPYQMNNTPSESVKYIIPFIKKFKKKYPSIPIETIDERFTSKIAKQSMIDGGMKKKQRQDKSIVDKVSASLILQTYMEYKLNENKRF